MKKYSIITIIVTSISIAIFSSCKTESTGEKEGEIEIIPEDIVEMRADQIKLAGIETGLVEFRSLSATVKVNGTISAAPQEQATVCIPLGGFTKSISVLIGSAVRKGQVLAVVENLDFVDIQQSYLDAKSKLEYAEAEYNRHHELYKEDVYSEKNVQQITADYKSQKALVKGLEQKLIMIGIDPFNLSEDRISRAIEVRSPIDGYVKNVNTHIGKYMAPTDVMFEVVNNDQLLLELVLFEKDINQVSIGQKVRFSVNNESECHTAQVIQTGKAVETDRTYKALAGIQGTFKNVLPGMYVTAVIETSGNNAPTVPTEAIVNFDDKNYVFIFEKEKEEDGKPFTEYRMIQVQKGLTDNGFTEIIFPAEIDYKSIKIVIKGAYNLLSAKKNAGEMAC